MSTLALFSIKGGVGKTTAAVNLAYVAAKEGARTLLWDLDPQAAASYCLGLDREADTGGLKLVSDGVDLDALVRSTAHEGLDLLPADPAIARGAGAGPDDTVPAPWMTAILEAASERYDHVVVDCQAGLSAVAENVLAVADAVIVPTIPTMLSTRTVEQLMAHVDALQIQPMVLPFLSMVDRRRQLHREVSREVAQDPSYLAIWVPYASPVERVGVKRGPIGSFARMTAPARAYELMWSEIEGRLSGEHISSAIRREAAERAAERTAAVGGPSAGAV